MKIGICTPCYGEMVHSDYMLSFIASQNMGKELGVNVEVYKGLGTSILPRVRNLLVARALADQCDWIIFIDDDIGWQPSDLFKLTKHGADIVAAGPAKRHHRWDEQPAAIAKFPQGTLTGVYTSAGRLWKMDAVATGFMAIKADVFGKIETTPYITEGTQVRTWFWLDLIKVDDHFEDEGEDYNFCRKVNESGGSCWVDPDIRVRHYTGNVCHDICFADLEIKQQEAA